MKPNYKNWVPDGLVYSVAAGMIISLVIFTILGFMGLSHGGIVKIVLMVVFGLAAIGLAKALHWCLMARTAFNYGNPNSLAWRIINGTADRLDVADQGRCLDVGCGSGALTIAVAKRNPDATVVGVDRWGKEYASFNRPLCEENAKAEGVSNVEFMQGDATRLDFPDESFDAVTSNYVYHNISVADKQKLLLETLRVLKKGGTFAIHDIMTPRRYGDMEAFVAKLKEQGYEKVELIDTSKGLFMGAAEAKQLQLTGSTLLIGKK